MILASLVGQVLAACTAASLQTELSDVDARAPESVDEAGFVPAPTEEGGFVDAHECIAGFYLLTQVTSEGVSACAPCPSGQFSTEKNAPRLQCPESTWDHDQTASTPCMAVAHCSAGEHVAAEPTELSDRVCAAVSGLSRIQRGETTLAAGLGLVDIAVSTVGLSKSFLIFSVITSNGAPRFTQVAGYLLNAQTIRFERYQAASSPDAILSWYVVSFTNGSFVQRSTASFGVAETIKSVTMSQFSTDSSLVTAGGLFGRGGSCDASTGVSAICLLTMTIGGETLIDVKRELSGQTTYLDISVITFAR